MTGLRAAAAPAGGRLLDARLSLLDRQVLDVDGVPVGVVDDLELDDIPPGVIDQAQPAPSVRAMLHGGVVLERLFGGRRPRAHFERIDWDTVGEIGPAIRLAAPASLVPTSWLEDWLRDNLIARIPGGRHVPG
ncbi:hypothetical protein [Propionicimonas sp.]|uniref:hypothetical protein n=1 Tax=Propionicimonas sp. TaxID=1955623 RepID=UPI0039E58A16